MAAMPCAPLFSWPPLLPSSPLLFLLLPSSPLYCRLLPSSASFFPLLPSSSLFSLDLGLLCRSPPLPRRVAQHWLCSVHCCGCVQCSALSLSSGSERRCAAALLRKEGRKNMRLYSVLCLVCGIWRCPNFGCSPQDTPWRIHAEGKEVTWSAARVS